MPRGMADGQTVDKHRDGGQMDGWTLLKLLLFLSYFLNAISPVMLLISSENFSKIPQTLIEAVCFFYTAKSQNQSK